MDSDFRPAKRPVESLRDDPQQTPKPIPENFQTPEQVAATDTPSEKLDISHPSSLEEPVKKSVRDWVHHIKLRWPPTKREWLYSTVSVLICGSIVAFGLAHIGSKPVAHAAIQTAPKPKPAPPKVTTVPSTLSGLPVDPSVNQRPVTAVMIENTTDARPQSGLSQAGVVFEAIAEGGVTRFLALYQDTQPANLGPVRSARPYYIQWAMGFDAGYAHVGGSPDALADIKSWNVRDLDEFHNAGAYHRISSRVAPHNMYTSIAALNQLETSKGYTSSSFTGFIRKPAAPAKTPTVKSISLTLSGPIYNAHYDYHPATNSYGRSEGGALHIDANTGQQIAPNVVVAMVVPMSRGALDTSGAYYSNYAAIGSGPVSVFQDGTLTTGTWTKASPTSQIVFTDASGKPLKLDPGQTWITAVATASDIASGP